MIRRKQKKIENNNTQIANNNKQIPKYNDKLSKTETGRIKLKVSTPELLMLEFYVSLRL